MFDFIYAEVSILDHPRTHALLDRFPCAQQVPCARYGSAMGSNGSAGSGGYPVRPSMPSLTAALERKEL